MEILKTFTIPATKNGLFWIIALGIILMCPACQDDINLATTTHPFLEIINEMDDEDRAIVSVSLVGYEFEPLSILPGNSQTLKLDKGMPAGYDNIFVRTQLSGPQIIIRNVYVDFADGKTRTLTFKGCFGASGCEGYTVEVE